MKDKVSILFTGDFCPQGRVEERILKNDLESLYDSMVEDFRRSDLAIVDLECPLLEQGDPIPKTGPNLKACPAGIEALRYLGVQLVAMANNHILDYGVDGLNSTIDICKKAGISTVGVGINRREAGRPFVTEIHGRKIAVLNITENEWSNASETRAGANPLDLIRNFNDIRMARRQCDIVIIVFHGGNEFYGLPSPRLKETFRFFVDAGASAVIAHHTHIVSGYELYQEAPIFYGLGNFCFDWPGKRKSFWNEGMAVRLVFGEDAAFEIIPFRQNDEAPGVFKCSEMEANIFREKITRLNKVIADDDLLAHHFEKFCLENKVIYDLYLQPYRNKLLQSLRKRRWIPSLLSGRKKRLILNLTRCEAHRDVLIKNLSD